MLAILFLTVVAGVLTIRGFDDVGAFPLTDFATGLKIFFASPTTINMGIVISEQAGGNGAVVTYSVKPVHKRGSKPWQLPGFVAVCVCQSYWSLHSTSCMYIP